MPTFKEENMLNRKTQLRKFFPVILLILSALVQAQIGVTIQTRICPVIYSIFDALWKVASTLVLLMMIYAGVKYVYSADDPGGRKQARSIIVNSLIGGIIVAILTTLFALIFTAGSFYSGYGCPGVAIAP